jgi:uncharacterized protein YutE (UPF0331/DUF86 family)
MTPARLDPEVVMVRLERITALLSDLETVGEPTAERFEREPIPRFAAERILIALVDLAVGANSHVLAATADVPPGDYRSSFTDLADHDVLDQALAERLAACAGLRNVLVHLYLDIDVAIVARAAQTAPADFAAYRDQLAAWLRDQQVSS